LGPHARRSRARARGAGATRRAVDRHRSRGHTQHHGKARTVQEGRLPHGAGGAPADRAHRHQQRPRRAAEARLGRTAGDDRRRGASAHPHRRLGGRDHRRAHRRGAQALRGHPPGMVKLIFLCRRRPDLTHEQYVERLLGGPVHPALRHHPTMRGYVVNIVETSGPGPEPLDSIAELSFDTLADFEERLYDSPEGRTAIERDVAGFLTAADAYVTQERTQLSIGERAATGTRTPGVKLVCPVQRRSDLSRDAFTGHWLGTHAPIARAHHPGLTRYFTNVVERRLGSGGEAWDGFTELHFASAEPIAGGLFDSPEGERAVRDDI